MPFFKNSRFAITLDMILRENPKTSFVPGFNPADLGYTFYWDTPRPEYDPISQTVVELPPVHDGARWLEAWEVRNLDAETVAANQAREVEQHNANIKAQITAIEATQDRAVREAALTGDTTFLASINAKIVALRGQFK